MIVGAVVSLLLGAEPIRLAPGVQQVVAIPGLTRVAVGRDAVADVRAISQGELLVTGNQVGSTTLTIWTNRGVQTRTIIVNDGRSSEVGRMVKELVNPGLRVETFNGFTVVDGVLDSIDELRRLEALVGNDASVKVLAKVDPRVMPAVAANISAAFQRQGLANARATAYGGKIVLEGSVADQNEMEKAVLIAQSYVRAVTPALTVR